jgi:putative membrane protein
MNYATTDLHLAIAHHLLIFLLAGILAFEIGAIRLTMTCDDINRVGRVDLWYGILAAAIIAVGLSRAILAAKGGAYYSVNGFFWAKMAAFAAVALLSIVPTRRIISWQQALAAECRIRSGRRRYSQGQAPSVGRGGVLHLDSGVC